MRPGAFTTVIVACIVLGTLAAAEDKISLDIALRNVGNYTEPYCNPLRCYTSGATPMRTTSNASDYYPQCIALAEGKRAFQCRCTKSMLKCLVAPHGGNCTDIVESYEMCKKFVLEQNWDCNFDKLCRSPAQAVGALGAVVVGILVSILM